MAKRQAIDLRQQGARGLIASASGALVANDEITQLNVSAAQPGQQFASRVRG
jgi:hypothetical protein